MSQGDDTFTGLPDPGHADTLDSLSAALRLLKVWAGDPSYDTITARINKARRAASLPGAELARKTTVVDCFKAGRRRLNTDLVLAVVQALHPDVGYLTQWRQALRVIGGEARAAAQVRVLDALPPTLAEFTGRAAELHRLHEAAQRSEADGTALVVISGMAGVGKTQLAVHTGHRLLREALVDRVLFVNLRGFHPDRAQPPADPGAVLDGFLRLLGVPGQQIPHDLAARTALFRRRLAGTRTLVLLDNAATAEQVRPLLSATASCPVLLTSRRSLTGLGAGTDLTVEVFSAAEAATFLARALPQVPVGADPRAPMRIARRCGYLPLALGLLAGHIRSTSGWTLTDHADRLDERHRDRHLDTGIQLAIDLSYQHLSTDQQRLLRLAALHPGQDFDAYAAAALAGTDLPVARAGLDHLHRDHLLQQAGPGRYTFHDLIRAHATGRGADEDPPPDRRAALTRLFDYYLAAMAAAVDTVYPAETTQRPRVSPAGSATPPLSDPGVAIAWLDAERPSLLAVAAHTATHGWADHTIALSRIGYRYLDGGHPLDALSLHGHAHHVAVRTGDVAGQAHALHGIGTAHLRLGRYGGASEHLRQSLELFRQVDDRASQARVLGSLGNIEKRQCHYPPAIDHHRLALDLFQQVGDRAGEARALRNLGVVEGRQGNYPEATAYLHRALRLCRQVGDRIGEADAVFGLGEVAARLGRYPAAATYYEQAIDLFRKVGDRMGEIATLDDLGIVCTRLGQFAEATAHHQRALLVYREVGDRDGEAWALNGLGEATLGAGRPDDALAHHSAAHAIAIEIGSGDQRARAHAGLGHARQALDQPTQAREQFEQALALYVAYGMPEAEQLQERLAATYGLRN